MKRALLGALLLTLLALNAAQAATLAGVQMPDQVTVDGTTLVLNGIGLRTAFFVKAYVGALYLKQRTTHGKVVLDSPQPKQVMLKFLRDIGRDRLASGWSDELQKVAGKSAAPAIDQFTKLIPDVKEGDTMSFTWRPGVGVEVAVNGQVRGSIAGDAFARSLFALWFGKKPGDESLKRGMLGK